MNGDIQNMKHNDLLSTLWIDFCNIKPSNDNAADAMNAVYEKVTNRPDIFNLKHAVDLWDAAKDKFDSDSEVRALAMGRVQTILNAIKN